MNDEQSTDQMAELSQVRDLLFGHQMRDIESRFDSIREELRNGLSELRHSLNERVSTLETSVRQEISSLDQKAQDDKSGLNNALQTLGHQLSSDFVSKSNELSSRLESTEDTLRKYTLEQTQNLWEDLKNQYETLSGRVDRDLDQLRQSSTERVALSEMFQELAVRLSENTRHQVESVNAS